MKYNQKYFICKKDFVNDKLNFEVEQVYGSPTKIEVLTGYYYNAPKLFIHKIDNVFRLSEATTGLMIDDFLKLKDLNDYIANNDNIDKIFNALNTPYMAKHIDMFNQLIKEYQKQH